MIRLYRQSMLLLVSMLFAFPSVLYSSEDQPESKTVIGKIIAGSGTLLVRAQDNTERRLQRRSPVYAGDTVVVGENGFVQIRFVDNTLIALQPNSEFVVEEYVYHGKEDGSGKLVFNLLKGGLRTISGTIGKKNEENYRMKTPVATIGIRGTHYGLRICQQNCDAGASDGLYGGVLEGKIFVDAKGGGEGLFGKDGFFFVNPFGQELQRLDRAPGFVFVDKIPLPQGGQPKDEGGKGEKGDQGEKEGAIRLPRKTAEGLKVKDKFTLRSGPDIRALPTERTLEPLRTDTLEPVNTLPVLSPTTIDLKTSPILQPTPILETSPIIQLQTLPTTIK